jgi:hypothetical protein
MHFDAGAQKSGFSHKDAAIRQLSFERFTLKEHIGVAEMLGDNRSGSF